MVKPGPAGDTELVGAAAQRVVDRRRLAALPRRYLEDAGMSFADLDAALRGMDAYDPHLARHALACPFGPTS